MDFNFKKTIFFYLFIFTVWRFKLVLKVKKKNDLSVGQPSTHVGKIIEWKCLS